VSRVILYDFFCRITSATWVEATTQPLQRTFAMATGTPSTIRVAPAWMSLVSEHRAHTFCFTNEGTNCCSRNATVATACSALPSVNRDVWPRLENVVVPIICVDRYARSKQLAFLRFGHTRPSKTRYSSSQFPLFMCFGSCRPSSLCFSRYISSIRGSSLSLSAKQPRVGKEDLRGKYRCTSERISADSFLCRAHCRQ